MSTKSKQGFTIIEVVLVLAIAGLIFLMVFIALPNMQSAQRNTRRRNDYSSLSTMISSYVSNNNGNLPTTDKIKATWLNAQGQDPDGEPYKSWVVVDCSTNKKCEPIPAADNIYASDKISRNEGQFYLYTSASCVDGTPTFKQGRRNFAIYGYIEDGANTAGTYCLEGTS
ncbi:type II secretion system protein [Candidatus Saccharibacteria bacterium]|nr:type II secretion system protein [Candidatus Saccharibacteria bacterium]